MPCILARGEQNNVANPKLVFIAQSMGPTLFTTGKLVDPFSASFEVFDISTDAKRAQPGVVVASTPIDLVVDRTALGRFAPDFTLAATNSVGRHLVRFTFVLVSGGPARTETHEFDVVDSIATFQQGPTYCFPSDLKDEGVCGKTDAFLLGRINLASRFVERITGRFFEPRTLALNLDGRGGRMLLLDIPIVAIEKVAFETSPFQPSSLDVDADLLRVYARHISQGLTQPDDRNNPKIELYHASDDITNASPYVFTRLIYPRGQQNIIVDGVFGYTDPNGTMCGGTPDLIRRAAMLLVMRDMAKLGETAKRDDAQKRFRITAEKTRDQSYTLEGLMAAKRFGMFTGDPEIDTILASYMRQPKFGAA